jgi:hypothetical protein
VDLAVQAEEEDSKPRLRELETLYDILDAHRDTILSRIEEAAGNSGRIAWGSWHDLDLGQTFSSLGPLNEINFSLIRHAAYVGLFSFVSRKISLFPNFLKLREDLNLREFTVVVCWLAALPPCPVVL